MAMTWRYFARFLACRRLTAAGFGSAVLMVGILSPASSALASLETVGTFATTGTSALGGEGVAGVAVDDATGDVYVDDTRHHRVERFSSAGTFLESWGWGVATGANEFQTCTVSCDQEGLAGSESGEFEQPEGIAVDQATGDVYVLDIKRASDVVQKFGAEGEYIAGFGERGSNDAQIEELRQQRNDIAVGPEGDVYLIDDGLTHGPRVMVFDNGGAYVAGRDIGHGVLAEAIAVATDSFGDVLVIDGSSGCVVDKFDSAGALIWKTPEECSKQSLATDATGDTIVYMRNGNRFVQLDREGKEIGQFSGVAEEEFTTGLAYSPDVSWAPGRPPGILYAVNLNETTELGEGLIFAQPPVVAPGVDSESASDIGTNTAVLAAQINPHGNDTRYVFEYGISGPCSSGPCSKAPAEEVDLGAIQGDVAANVTLSGLSPETTYYYRAVATNAGGVTVGTDGTFRTFGASAGEPADQRRYELVSPVAKDGGEVFPPDPVGGSCFDEDCKPGRNDTPMPMLSGPAGDTVAYEGYPFNSTDAATGANEYLASRSAEGWNTQDLSPARQQHGQDDGYKGFSTDLAHGVLSSSELALTADAPVGFANLYLRDSQGDLSALNSVTPPHRAPGHKAGSFQLYFAGASANYTHVIFEANDTLTTNAVDGGSALNSKGHPEKGNLYEWTAGHLTLINALSDGTTTGPGAVFGWEKKVKAPPISVMLSPMMVPVSFGPIRIPAVSSSAKTARRPQRSPTPASF